MKRLPIQQNLSTSFVDVAMLIRFLRDRSFTGTVRIEWDGYDGELFFTRSPRIHAREYDRRIGRIAQGQNALRRILERSRRPSGRISIFRNDPEKTAGKLQKAFVDDRILAGARTAAFGQSEQLAPFPAAFASPQETSQRVAISSAKGALLATDLLLTFKESFERTRLNFDTAFAIACGFYADEFPFLDPERQDFSFFKDEIFIGEGIGTTELFAGIVAALRYIIDRISSEERFRTAAAYLRHRLQFHLSDRNDDYRDLGLTEIVDRLIK